MYELLSGTITDSCLALPESVVASSTRNSYYAASNTIDGGLTTAWGPAATDTLPTLTFDLADAISIHDLAIKLSLGTVSEASNQRVLVDVAVSDGGGFTTIATGLTPNETQVTEFQFGPADASQVRLTFHAVAGADISQLLVCDVAFSGCPLPGPSPTPSTPPSISPCAKVTGGGWVPSSGPGKPKRATFGFVANGEVGGAAKGNIEVIDHANHLKWHGTVTAIDSVDFANEVVTFSGTLKGKSGGTFSATVDDNGEPGTADTFVFRVNGVVVETGTLGGGNIQFHDKGCKEEVLR